ncbi:hypothetical protein F5Y01DRAFT_145829 [Xylaria sp. FL0043]|nr:hypothetical protein F5Y01DRAFT_145829 [Xylaria sp. FL0043]
MGRQICRLYVLLSCSAYLLLLLFLLLHSIPTSSNVPNPALLCLSSRYSGYPGIYRGYCDIMGHGVLIAMGGNWVEANLWDIFVSLSHKRYALFFFFFFLGFDSTPRVWRCYPCLRCLSRLSTHAKSLIAWIEAVRDTACTIEPSFDIDGITMFSAELSSGRHELGCLFVGNTSMSTVALFIKGLALSGEPQPFRPFLSQGVSYADFYTN